MHLPQEIAQKILYDYIPLYMTPMKPVHDELLAGDLTLHLTETLFDFEVDFHYITRLPRLIHNETSNHFPLLI